MESKSHQNYERNGKLDDEDDNPYLAHEKEKKKQANGAAKPKKTKESLYEMLGVAKDATVAQIKTAYKKLALVSSFDYCLQFALFG